MPSERELHARFWAEAARKLDEGNLIPWILNEAAAEFEGTELAQPLEQVARDVEGGKDLWQALAGQSGAFSDTVWSMVRAADAAGTLAEAVRAIAEGTEDGALPVPGAGLGCDEDVAWWRCLGRLLGAGVPLLEAIRLVHNEVTADRLAEATRHIKAEMLKGRTMASAMRDLPEVFSKSQAFAVEMVEGSGGLAQRALEIADALPETDVGGLVVEGMEDIAAQQPVRKFVNTGLCIALSRGVSDIHVEPTESGRSRFRVRIDGVLTDLDWPEDVEVSGPVPHGEVINRIKIMAGMDLTQRQLPQDGRIEINLAGEPFDVRVSIVPTDFGERAVMRVLSRKWVPLDLAGLGILDDDLGALRALAHRPHGIVLCVGPTGSGKTTLAYAMLNELERDSICVMSIEDPVEYRLDGVAQIQVRPQAGLTFARAARGVFRQDPDVIFIDGRYRGRPFCRELVRHCLHRPAACPRAVQGMPSAGRAGRALSATGGQRVPGADSRGDLLRAEGLRGLQRHRLSRPPGDPRDPDRRRCRQDSTLPGGRPRVPARRRRLVGHAHAARMRLAERRRRNNLARGGLARRSARGDGVRATADPVGCRRSVDSRQHAP
jgi:hypothetical protein